MKCKHKGKVKPPKKVGSVLTSLFGWDVNASDIENHKAISNILKSDLAKFK